MLKRGNKILFENKQELDESKTKFVYFLNNRGREVLVTLYKAKLMLDQDEGEILRDYQEKKKTTHIIKTEKVVEEKSKTNKEQDLEALKEQYEAKFGKKPHPASKAETLIAKLK